MINGKFYFLSLLCKVFFLFFVFVSLEKKFKLIVIEIIFGGKVVMYISFVFKNM